MRIKKKYPKHSPTLLICVTRYPLYPLLFISYSVLWLGDVLFISKPKVSSPSSVRPNEYIVLEGFDA